MKPTLISIIVAIFITVFASKFAFGQANTNPWPGIGKVGIGTQLPPIEGPFDLLHIRGVEWAVTDASYNHPALRISLTPQSGAEHFGQLAMENNEHYSSLSQKYDFVLRSSQTAGNLFIADGNSTSSVRVTTTPDATTYPPLGPNPMPPNPPYRCPWPWGDQERVTVAPNGNIGLDIPPDPITGLCNPQDQLQIGGGVAPAGQYTLPMPGLTIYGGNRFEGMQKPPPAAPTDTYPVDWRSIFFNHVTEHIAGSGGGGHRVANMPSSGICFAEQFGGLLHLQCSPATNDADPQRGVVLQLRGAEGITMWSDESSLGHEPFHFLFNVLRPDLANSTGDLGMFYHHTPVYIGGQESPTLLATVTPHIRQTPDGNTYMLVVNGSELAKEVVVRTDFFPDYVFNDDYRLPSLPALSREIKELHHLPDIPSAAQVADEGLELGKMEAKLLQKVEELTLYAIESDKEIKTLKNEIEGMKQSLKK